MKNPVLARFSVSLATLSFAACGAEHDGAFGAGIGLQPHDTQMRAAQTQVGANPFLGAALYVDPTYTASVDTSLAKLDPASDDAARARTARSFSTAVWLDRIGAIAGDSNAGVLSLGKSPRPRGRPV